MKKQGIYIHWPYCLSKCPYCDFFSRVKKDVPQDELIEKYIQDLDFYHEMTRDSKVGSIFFGGGTPSLISPYNIEKIINHIQKKWQVEANLEISLEANPNTNRENLFSDLRLAGINRLSLGVQSLRDNDLRLLGRTHSSSQALEAISEVLSVFDNHSVDIIYALPYQQLYQWREDLNCISDFGFKHISLYQLMIEEGTVFAKKGIEPMEDEKASLFYDYTRDILAKKGYNHYEISNFAKKGYESRHNLGYWKGTDYIGIGPSAHGRIGLKATTHKRNIEVLNHEERALELLIMGLRIAEGIDKRSFFQICGLEFDEFVNRKKIDEFNYEGLLENDINNIRLTKKGFLLLNFVVESLI